MCHGGEIHHEGCGPKVIKRGISALRAGREHRFLKRSNRKLPVRLTERDKSDSSGHQIRDITLQKGGQSEAQRNALRCTTNSEKDS